MRTTPRRAGGGNELPESLGYSLKRRLLGAPMVNEELQGERLSNPIALGVLSPDCISSSAYGTEEILLGLMQGGLGLAAFAILLPITAVILLILVLVMLSYREVVSVYTKTGGSYVVAREAFGPRVAQIAAVALLIDYTVTVAVQTAAGTAAVISIPALSFLSPYAVEITVAVILAMCYANLRGIKEAGRWFAVPTYLFAGSMTVMIVAGVARKAAGSLPAIDPATLHGTYFHPSHSTSLLISFALILTLLRSFANGGSSLTGVEAVSNAVSVFRPPAAVNARRVLVTMAAILAFLICGIAWLAHATHATPYTSGTPTVVSQEASLVFGGGPGQIMYYVVQATTALVLYSGGNTSFNGFPFLASFVADDAFLPRWMTKRGHRLVFSNGIVTLTVVALALIIGSGAKVDALVPLYAIGVFTGFAMAGFGMTRYHRTHQEPGWRRRRAINFSAGLLSGIVVLIFAIAKFTEGAWIVVIAGPIMVYLLMRLNREYRMEAAALRTIAGAQPPPAPRYPRRVVFVLVDSFDLATLAALRYARSLRPTTLRATHFAVDNVGANRLRREWTRADRGVILDFINCADRRIARAAAELVEHEVEDPGTHVTLILPRRIYSPLLGRLLHDRTADKIAAAISPIPRSAATIVPYDVQARVRMLQEHQAAAAGPAEHQAAAAGPAEHQAAAAGPAEHPPGGAGPAGHGPGPEAMPPARRPRGRPGAEGRRDRAVPVAAGDYDHPAPPAGVNPIGSLAGMRRATVEGRVRVIEIRPVGEASVLACEISDSSGDLTALFYGRTHIPGVDCGSRVRFRGPVGVRGGVSVMVNPYYELVSPEPNSPTAADEESGTS